jgi:hypothetical protein
MDPCDEPTSVEFHFSLHDLSPTAQPEGTAANDWPQPRRCVRKLCARTPWAAQSLRKEGSRLDFATNARR